MSCPSPADFQNLVVDPNSAVCDQLRKLGLLAQTVADAYACIYNENGSFTDEFTNRICATGCGGGSNTSTGGGTDILDAVTDLSMPTAYRHQLSETYRLKWSPVFGATKYAVYRNTTSNFATATLILAATAPDDATVEWLPVSGESLYLCDDYVVFFDDVLSGSTTNTLFYYWVKPYDDSGNFGPESNVASGRRFKNYSYYTFGGMGPYINPASPYTVPAGFSKFVFSLVAGGGGGGGGSMTNAGGGGGGGGVLIGEVAVAENNQFYADLGTLGDAAGGGNSANGSAGTDAVLYFRAANTDPWIEIARASGGAGGVYNGAGGAGGSTFTYNGTYFTGVIELPGIAGEAASGGNGGFTGAQAYDRRWPQGTSGAVPTGGYYAGETAGGGSDRANDLTALPFAEGGDGGTSDINFGFVV